MQLKKRNTLWDLRTQLGLINRIYDIALVGIKVQVHVQIIPFFPN